MFADKDVITLRRYDLHKTYYIERHHKGKNPICLAADLTGNLDVPSFANWTFTGTHIHDGLTVDSWKEPTSSNPTTYMDYETTDKGKDIPFEFLNEDMRLRFFNFNPMKLPASVFDVPSVCPSENNPMALEEKVGGCSFVHKLECAGIIALCTVACCAGECIIDPDCISCLGSAYEKCKGCF